MQIRKATIQDTVQLVPLYAGSLRTMVQLQPRRWQEAKQDIAFVQAGIQGEDSDVLVAEQDGHIVGLAAVFSVTVEPRPYRLGHTYCKLDTLYVLEEYRNRGIGIALLCATQNWAKERGHTSLQLMTLGENEGARRFYASAGLREHQIIFIEENL